eukprot:1813512-Heterocapsa_arctica.AAC.1
MAHEVGRDLKIAHHRCGRRAARSRMPVHRVVPLAVGEFAAWQMQFTEEKWRDRVLVRADAETTTDQHLYSGLKTRGSFCICPELSAWIAGELSIAQGHLFGPCRCRVP